MLSLLVILGFTLYLILRYRVAPITKTPIWLLWFVLMIPALIMVAWAQVNGESESLPRGVLILSFVASAVSYIALVQAGRKPIQPPSTKPRMDEESPEASDLHQDNAQENSPPGSVLAAQDKTAPKKKFLDQTEESQLKHCFPWSIYQLKNLDYRPQAVICRGQLRADPEVAYSTIQKNVQEQFGDRFLVVFQSAGIDQTYFVLVPNPQAHLNKKLGPIYRPGFALALMVATLLTTSLAGLAMARPDLNSNVINVIFETPNLILLGLPYGLTLMLILGIHELGHFLAARYYKLKASLPYFIPFPFSFGTFGAFVQVRSPMPNRKTLFDVGIAGPLAGLVIAIPALLWGLFHSELVALPTDENNPINQAFDPKNSLLFFLLSKAVYGAQLSADQGISLHPVAIAGGLGLAVTAINLMPVGQLDGGHIIHAMFGQRKAAIIGHVARLLLLCLAFVQPILLIFAIFLLFMPVIDQPALNDVCELDDARDFLGLVSLAFLLSIILPAPPTLANLLALAHP